MDLDTNSQFPVFQGQKVLRACLGDAGFGIQALLFCLILELFSQRDHRRGSDCRMRRETLLSGKPLSGTSAMYGWMRPGDPSRRGSSSSGQHKSRKLMHLSLE
jgi:hypothetical protein